MNNSAQRQITKTLKETINFLKINDYKDFDEFKKQVANLFANLPTYNLYISSNALNYCLKENVLAYDFFLLNKEKLIKKYNEIKLEPLKLVFNIKLDDFLLEFYHIYKQNQHLKDDKVLILFRHIYKKVSWCLVLKEDNKNIDVSNKDQFIAVLDLWLTPKDVITQFFKITELDPNLCLDPCASDNRWLNNKGVSIDILPMTKNVIKQNFLTLKNEDVLNDILISNLPYVVGNIPFSLLNEFVNHAFELNKECYFLVSGDTIFKYYAKHIKHLYIFSGLEGNQKDNRSRCEFDTPFLIKSALWCCIVHLIKEEVKEDWIIQHNISNQEKRDGKHVAVGKNTFIKSNTFIKDDHRISKIQVHSAINWKNGKTIKEE